MKTRSKRAQQEQAGVPPTPPQQLPTARSTRQKRHLRSTASPEAPSDSSAANLHPQHTTIVAEPTNTTRGRKRKNKKPLKSAETSLPEIVEAEQVNVQSHQSEVHSAEIKRETQDSSLNPPSSLVNGQDLHGTPVAGFTALKRSPESSPLSPPPSTSPVFPSDVKPLVIPVPAEVSDPLVALETPCPTKTSGSVRQGVTTGASSDKTTFAHQDQIYGWPREEQASEDLTVVNFMINEDFQELVTTGATNDPLLIAIPTKMLPDLLKFISRHAHVRNTSIENLLTDEGFMHRLRKRLTDIDSIVNGDSPPTLKRKLPSPDSREPSAPDPARLLGKTRPSRLRQLTPGRVVGRPASSPRRTLHERHENDQESEERPPKRTKRVPQLYDENGMLTLGVYKEVLVDDSSEDGDVQNSTEVTATAIREPGAIPEPTQTPETPGTSRWGRITSFLPSVSRFIPSFTSPTRPQQHEQAQVPRTEPRPRQEQTEIRAAPSTSSRASQRYRELTNRRQLLTKGEKEIIRKQKEEIKRLRAQLEKQKEKTPESATIHEDDGDEPSPSAPTLFLRRAKRDAEELAARQATQIAQKQAEEAAEKEAQAAGSKRKRSLDVIPNPEGGGYGMDLQYFGLDSDEETFLETDEQSGGGFSAKRARLSVSNDVVGDPHQATPYTGTLFAIPGVQAAPPSSSNSFVAQDLSEAAALDQAKAATTPGPNLTFTVPSDSDSDDDSDGHSEEDSAAHKSAPKALSSGVVTSSPAPKALGMAITTPGTLAPAQSQQPSTAALDKARKTALKHQPIQPSRLREASRLSTSTMASSAGTDDSGEVASEFTSYEHFQQLVPDRVRDAISNSAPETAAKSSFEKAFAKWDAPHTSRLPDFQAELKLSTFDFPQIDQKVLDRIEMAWINKDKKSSSQDGREGSLGAFEKSLGTWMDHRNNAQAVGAFGS